MSFQTSILDLSPEILEIIFQKISATKDIRNCQIACKMYTDPRILNILNQIQFDNEGNFCNYLVVSFIISIQPIYKIF